MATENIVNVVFKASMQGLMNGVKTATDAVVNLGMDAAKSAGQFVKGFSGAGAKTEILNADVQKLKNNVSALGATGAKSGKDLGNGFKYGANVANVSVLEIANKLMQMQKAARMAGNQMHDYMNMGGRGARYASTEVDRLKSAIATLVTAYAGKELIKFTIGSAFDREQTEMQYEVLLKSAIAAKQRVEEITKFADVTPFEMPELLRMDKVLETYKIRTMDWIRTIGDTASALEDPKEKLLEISSYLGRIASGQTGEALQRFEELGVITRARLKEMGLIFDRQNAYKGKISDLMNAIYSELNTNFGGMMEKLSKSGAGLISTLSDSFKAVGREIGMGAMAQAKGAIQDLLDLLQRMREDGSLEDLSQSLGSLISKIIGYLRELLLNADEVITKINDFADSADLNFGKLIKTLEIALDAWLALKAAMIIAPLVQGLVIGIGLLTGAIKGATLAQWLLNAALNANPIGIIVTLVGTLIFALIRLYKTNETARKIIITAWDAVKIAFLLFTRDFLEFANTMVRIWDFLHGWIPALGKAFDGATDIINGALQKIDKQIDVTRSKIIDLWQTASEGISGTSEDVAAKESADEAAALAASKELRKPKPTPTPSKPPTYSTTAPATGKKDTRTYAEKQIEAVEEKYGTTAEVIQSRIDIAKTQGLTGMAKAFTQNLISTLSQQAKELLGAQAGAKTEKDKNVIEIARNKLLNQIYQLVGSIEQGVTEMIGGFNAPSELEEMTKYQYTVNQQTGSTITKTSKIEQNIEVHVTIPDADQKGVDKMKQAGKNLGTAYGNGLKNSIVEAFNADVGRN